jgi:hypothetical protein
MERLGKKGIVPYRLEFELELGLEAHLLRREVDDRARPNRRPALQLERARTNAPNAGNTCEGGT